MIYFPACLDNFVHDRELEFARLAQWADLLDAHLGDNADCSSPLVLVPSWHLGGGADHDIGREYRAAAHRVLVRLL